MEFKLALKLPDFSLGLYKGKEDQATWAKGQGQERGMWFWRTAYKSIRLKTHTHTQMALDECIKCKIRKEREGQNVEHFEWEAEDINSCPESALGSIF